MEDTVSSDTNIFLIFFKKGEKLYASATKWMKGGMILDFAQVSTSDLAIRCNQYFLSLQKI